MNEVSTLRDRTSVVFNFGFGSWQMNVLALLWFLVRLSKTHLRWFVGRGRQQGLRASVSVCLCVCVCVCMCATPVPKDVGRTSALLKAGGWQQGPESATNEDILDTLVMHGLIHPVYLR